MTEEQLIALIKELIKQPKESEWVEFKHNFHSAEVIFYNEIYQLPAVNFIISEKKTRVTLFSYKDLNDLDKKDKIQACYQHACLKYVSNDQMTNQSLRERFQIEERNAAIASRILKETLKEELIKEEDPSSNSRKYKKYIPFWA